MEQFTVQELQLLKYSQLLRRLSSENLTNLLSITTKQSRAVGDTILTEGNRSDKIFLILSGKVSLFKKDDSSQQLITTLGPGESFGEMRLIKDQPCILTVVVSEPTILAAISIAELKLKYNQDTFIPILTSTFNILNERIINTNMSIAKNTHLRKKRQIILFLSILLIAMIVSGFYYL